MEPILASYVVNIATGAILEAAIRIKETQDGRRAEGAGEATRRADLFKDFEVLVLPKIEEVFADFEVHKDLHDFLLAEGASEALRSELLRQAGDLSWSKEYALATLSVPEGFGLMTELEGFVERLIRAIQRSVAEDQPHFNEATTRALGNLQSSTNRIEDGMTDLTGGMAELKGLMQSFLDRQSWTRPTDMAGTLGSLRPHIDLSVFDAKYRRDYGFVSELLDNGQLNEADLCATRLIADIEIDREHLQPQFKAAVLTLRAHARLRQNLIQDSNQDFREAYESHFDDVSGVNFAASLMRQGFWDEARPISKHLLDSFPSDFRCRVISANLTLQSNPSADVESILNEVGPKTADDYVLLAELRFNQNDYDRTVDAARSALQLDPNDLYAKFYLAHGLAFDLITSPRWAFKTEEQERIREAIQLLSDVRETFESEKQLFSLETVYVNLGVLHLKLGENSTAMAIFDSGLGLFPDSESLMVRQWRILTIAGEVDKAVALAQRLHEMSPSRESVTRVAMTYAMSGNFVRADSALEAAIKGWDCLRDDPDFTILRCHILTHSEPPRYREAGELLDRALLQNPDYADLWVIRAEVHQTLGDSPRAISDLVTALKTDPNDLVVRGAAKIFASLEEWPHAHGLLKSRAIDSFDDPHLFLAVEMAIFADDFNEAWRLLELVIPTDPKWLRFQGRKADLLVREGRFDEAEVLLNLILQGGELAELARMNLAGMLLELGHADRSFRIISSCLPEFSFVGTAVLGAETLARLNRPDEAVKTAISAIDVEFDNTEALRIFVLCYEQKIKAGGVLTPADDVKFEAAKLRLTKQSQRQAQS